MKLTKLVNSAADRLLDKLLPQSIAGACVPEHGNTYRKYCYCSNGSWYKTCRITCTGTSDCGPCEKVSNAC